MQDQFGNEAKPQVKTRIPFGKFGMKIDPRGAQAISDGLCTCGRRDCLFDVLGATYDSKRGYTWLEVRHFNGESHPLVSASAVFLLNRD